MYSPVIDTITFHFLISMAVSKRLEMCLMDVVTAYLYGSLDSDIHMKIFEGYKMPEAYTSRNLFSIKLQRSLYVLKQSSRMWYKCLSEYLMKEGYKNDPIYPCVFIKKSEIRFAIIVIYVDDMNLIGTPEELSKTVEYLKKEFEVKDLGKTKLCLSLKLEHKENEIIVHQSAYTKRVLKCFCMDNAYPLSTLIVVLSLEPHKDLFHPKEPNEKIFGLEVPYLNAIEALMYLAQCTKSNIAFTINLLARFSSEPTRRHWNVIKHIFRYPQEIIDFGLFYSNETTSPGLVGYTDAGYKSNPHKAHSQTDYLFCYNGTAISWQHLPTTPRLFSFMKLKKSVFG